MSGMKFRRTCAICNTTFFTPDRRQSICTKCLKKRGQRDTASSPSSSSSPPRYQSRPSSGPSQGGHGPGGDRPRFQGSRGPGGGHGGGRPGGGGGGGRPKPGGRPSHSAPPKKIPKPPKTAVMTDELRQRITDAYQPFKESTEPLRIINAQISDKVWAKRALVMQVVSQVRGLEASASAMTITPEQHKQVVDMFLGFIRSADRPAEGRHKAVATALNIPVAIVRRVRRDWFKSQEGSLRELSREQLFSIEKTYWSELQKGQLPLAEIPENLAERLSFAPFQVMVWIDQLHESENNLSTVPDPTPEQHEEVVKLYKEYLAGDKPPAKALHKTIGEKVGITPNQVYKVLLEYRNGVRRQYRAAA
jgi:hypothetical protein